MINNKLILYKNVAKGFLELLTNKRCDDKERNWFWTFGIWNTWNGENVVTNNELKFAFAQPTN